MGLQVGNLQHLQPAMRATNDMGGANTRHLGAVGWQPTALQPAMRATNSRGGANMRHLGAVGWQPTAFTASNAGYKQQGWGQHEASWGCRVGNLQHLQPAMRATNSRGGANMRHLGAVGWQPTAFTASNAGYKQQGWRQHEASWGCRLATYSIYSQQCGLQTAGVVPT